MSLGPRPHILARLPRCPLLLDVWSARWLISIISSNCRHSLENSDGTGSWSKERSLEQLEKVPPYPGAARCRASISLPTIHKPSWLWKHKVLVTNSLGSKIDLN